MTGPLDLDDIARMVNRPGATPAPWPAVAAVEQPKPTADDLGLTSDPVAVVLAAIDQLTPAQRQQAIARLTADERADLAQYEQPTRPNLRSVA